VNPRLQKLALDWKAYVALVAAAGTAMSVLTDTVTKVTSTVSAFKGLPLEARWIVAAVFLVISIVFLVAALRRRSQLREKERFLLSSENPEHLVGREEEVGHLARQCGRHSMVFLVGDSGSGKSSLVRAGLTHSLLADKSTLAGHDFVPLIVDLSGVRWQPGLSLALARGLGKLPEGAWQALGGGDRPAADDVFRWLRNRPPHAPRRLLIILDQFDDYAAAHRAQFYDGTTLRRPKEIEELSKDWQSLATLLRSGSVCVLVVARSEAAGSLPALCFVEEAATAHEHLTRLQGNLVTPLLDRLTKSSEEHPVVSDPEFGWLQLRSRLLRDLQASGEGQVLPIQLAVALNSLRLLNYLTPTEYDRQGGLRGLERLHVERHAEKAAEATRVPPKAVLEALLTMVSPDGAKTKPVARAGFDAVLERYGATPKAAGRAILQLEGDRLIRRVLAEGAGSETLLLYHDYLARGVREAYRQANRWTELLRERAQLFQEALGWRQRWRARLSPGEQVRLLWERARGKFSFDDNLRFFGLSSLRWLPIALTLLVLGVGWREIDRYRKNQIAAEVMQAIGHESFISREEAEQFLRLSAAGRDAATHALRLAIGDTAIAERASRRVDQLVNLAVGLDPQGERSSALLKEIVSPTLENTRAESMPASLAADIGSKLHLSPLATKQIAKLITARMKTESDSRVLASLGAALGSLRMRLDSQDVAPGAAALVARMKTEPGSFSGVDDLGSALRLLSVKLGRRDAAPLATALVARIKTEPDIDGLSSLGYALGSLSARIERQDVAPLAATLVARMETEADSYALAALGSALGSLSARLERQDVILGAALLVTRMKTDVNSDALARLGGALGSLSAKLERQNVTPGAAALVTRMKTEVDSDALRRLGSALGSLSTKLERQDITPGAAALLTRMPQVDSDVLVGLGLALGSLSAKLERRDVAPGAAELVASMRTERDSRVIPSLGWALSSLSARLKRQDVVPGIALLVARIKTEADGQALASLTWALTLLGGRLERQDAVLVFGKIAKATGGSNQFIPSALTSGLIALGPELPNPVRLSVYPHPVRIEQVYVDLLKSPFMVGEARAELLKGLEQATGQKFSGNLWSFVDWATETDAGRALGLDLEGPSPWSGSAD
jgi:hypothetical protein